MITTRKVQPEETKKPATRRVRGSAKTSKAAKSNPVALVALDRPREIRVRQSEPTARPVRGARRVMVSASLFALLLAACASLVFGFRSERLKIAEIDTKGASPAVLANIGAAIGPSCQVSAAKTQDDRIMLQCDRLDPLLPSIVAFSSADLQDQIQRIPAVKSAHVQTQLPDRISISVEEREPEAGWIVGSSVYRVAADGTVLDQGPTDGLKVIIGDTSNTPVKAGDRVDAKAILGAEELQNRLPAELNIPIKQIQYSPTDGLAVVTDPDMVAMFGAPDNLGYKMAELQRIIQLAKDRKTAPVFVDVRYKTPFYRSR